MLCCGCTLLLIFCFSCVMQSLYCTHTCICMCIHTYIINTLLLICFSYVMPSLLFMSVHTHTHTHTYTHTHITFLLLLIRHALLDTLLFTLFRCKNPSMFKAYTHMYKYYIIYIYKYIYCHM